MLLQRSDDARRSIIELGVIGQRTAQRLDSCVVLIHQALDVRKRKVNLGLSGDHRTRELAYGSVRLRRSLCQARTALCQRARKRGVELGRRGASRREKLISLVESIVEGGHLSIQSTQCSVCRRDGIFGGINRAAHAVKGVTDLLHRTACVLNGQDEVILSGLRTRF